MKKNYSRRDFIGKTSAGLAGAAAISGFASSVDEPGKLSTTTDDRFSYEISPFVSEVERLPVEEIYDYHKYLSTAPVHVWRRNKNAERDKNEMSLPDKGWKICYLAGSGIILENAVEDFRDYLNRSHGIMIEKEAKGYLKDWKKYNVI